MKQFLKCSAAILAVAAPAVAFAQSTGSQDFEDSIVVTGAKIKDGIAGIVLPDTTKAKGVLTQEIISKQGSGNTILNAINLIPGVSFQNNDPYGSAGGTLNIRGFGPDRVSLTFDGMPLNDTGNYAIYSNQQLDPELIEEVNVNLGSTDVDSPTAAASGGTVNYRSINGSDDFKVTMVGAAGEYNMFRLFGLVETGVFTPFGTKAWFSASTTRNDVPFNNLGKIDKQQYNGKIYQPIGSNGDFVSIAGHWNANRNNFFGSLPLRTDTDQGRVAGSASSNRFPITKDERFYTVSCTAPAANAGVADAAGSCGTLFDYRYNPSNTGNIRINSRFTLADGLVLTVDPSYQYVKANGGGTATAREGYYDINPASGAANVQNMVGYFGGSPYFGRDLNGDGDILDQVNVLAPSQTTTDRFAVISSLRYDINEHHRVRVAYTFDHGRHRQTGEVGLIAPSGIGKAYFPVDNPQLDVNGNVLQKRDRLSYAILNQFSAEYLGEFLDESLTVQAGLRAPFFKRKLQNNCFTSSASGFVECFGTGADIPSNIGTLNPAWAAPQKRTYKYDKLLPSVGLNFKITPEASVFWSYSKGLSVPGTDSLYNAFYFARGSDGANPSPETTDSFDLGARYTTSKFQAQASLWYTNYENRLASSYDPELNAAVYRNLGKVEKYGIDGSISYTPVQYFTIYAFGSYLKSKIKDDIQVGVCPSNVSLVAGCLAAGDPVYAATAGKRESGAPVYTLGTRGEVNFEGVTLGIQAKRTGKRYVYDTNLPTYRNTTAALTPVQIYGAAAPAYTLVDLDARFSLEHFGAPGTWFQLNVSNLFDKFYVGGFGGNLNQTVNLTGSSTGTYANPGFVQIGSPRAISGSLHVSF
ncbi:TonB-dependent receptor [Sphingobium yanoikuyae]|uniref:Outer membrane receptor protein n=1 Tax=Sphingobium yanoikuyae TaxID=13690 RepID=A0A084EKY1_SPHYA|nr:TonB-dependent receptor [Sphingobium yanoikuyae]KEZ18623.1 Outer membrane receptor protein precursor [Sphingobium yanoikuyae]MDG2512780.1 TonB-dependent receptor [Sphingobium yanoikuyae]